MLEVAKQVNAIEESENLELDIEAPVLIKNFVIHKVFWRQREDHSKEPSFKLRDIENDVNGLSEQVVTLLGGLFKTTTLASGCFQSDLQSNDDAPPIEPSLFQTLLNQCVIGDTLTDFLNMTQRTTRDFAMNHWGRRDQQSLAICFFIHTNLMKRLILLLLCYMRWQEWFLTKS
ncbi:MAG: hypothetical protein ACRDBT_05790 [Aeromonas sp.]